MNNEFIALNGKYHLYPIVILMLMTLISSCGGGSSPSAEDSNISNTSNSVSSLVSVADELNSNQLENESNYNKFMDQVVAPILSSDAYEISVGEVRTLMSYREENPIKCFYPEINGIISSDKCFDKNSYPDTEQLWNQLFPKASYGLNFREKYPYNSSFNNFSDDIIVKKPFSPVMNWMNLDENKAIFFSVGLSLKSLYKEQMIKTLEELSEVMDQVSFSHLFPICTNNISADNGCSASGGLNAYKNGLCLFFGACYSPDFNIPINYDSYESFVVAYLDRSKKIEYFYDVKQRKNIASKNNWLLDIWYDFYTSFNGLANELGSKVNRFYSIRITLKDSLNNDLKIIDFESAFPVSRIRDKCVAPDIVDLVRIIPEVGFMAINKGSYTYPFLDQVIPITHIPSLMTVQRDRADDATSSCSESVTFGTSNIPFNASFTIVDEIDYEVVIELDDNTKNTSKISVEFVNIENADYKLNSSSSIRVFN